MSHPPVLVVGAGPTGLTLACALHRFGAGCRVVDRRPGPGTEPKALVLWSGALEALRRTGVAESVVAEALALSGATYWARRRRIGAVRFGRLAGTAFPAPLCLPQPVTERLLHERLIELGGRVEWGVEAVDADSGEEGAVVSLRDRAGRSERADVPWLVAADGIHSRMRPALGIPFAGRTYPREFLLGDGVLEGPAPGDEAQYHLTPDGVLVLVPLPGGGHRVFFDVAPDGEAAAPGRDELQRLLDARGPSGLHIGELWWTSRFRVHARVAVRFRAGRAFLAGDAAHCHSPAGGQGLNTGIQDGFDLGWKLAAVVEGAGEALLDSYEAERRPASTRAVRNADRQTRLWLLRSPLSRAVRDSVMGQLSRLGVLDRWLVPQLAQLDIDHSSSPAVADLAGREPAPRLASPGRRIPDTSLAPLAGTRAASLHEYLGAGRHAVVVFGGGAAQRLAVRAREALAARGGPGSVDVLWVRPDAGAAGEAGPAAAGRAGCDVAQERGRRLAGGVSWLAYVRPDGVLGARSGAARLDALLDRVPVGGTATSG